VYSIRIENDTPDTLIIGAVTNAMFHNDEVLLKYRGDGGIADTEFLVLPGDYADCGTAIAELKNELPFLELKIIQGSDTVVAKTETEVLELIEKDWLGRLKKPYRIRVNHEFF